MLTPPTDRLYKFQSIAGIALLLVGFTYPIQQYNEAELKRIDAAERVRQLQFAYGRYAERVNELISIGNKVVRGDLSRAEAQPLMKEILERDPKISSLDKDVQDTIVQSQKHIELAQHYQLMRNVWFAIGFICIVGGAYLGYLGFRPWLKQPKKER